MKFSRIVASIWLILLVTIGIIAVTTACYYDDVTRIMCGTIAAVIMTVWSVDVLLDEDVI